DCGIRTGSGHLPEDEIEGPAPSLFRKIYRIPRQNKGLDLRRKGDFQMENQDSEIRKAPEGEGPSWPPLANRLYGIYEGLVAILRALAADNPLHTTFLLRLIATLEPFFTWGLSEDGPFKPTPADLIRTLTQSVRTAVLVFAFGLTRNGRPGPC